MTTHDFVEDVATSSLITPVIGFDEHWPGHWTEQLSCLHDLILNHKELRCRDDVCVRLLPLSD